MKTLYSLFFRFAFLCLLPAVVRAQPAANVAGNIKQKLAVADSLSHSNATLARSYAGEALKLAQKAADDSLIARSYNVLGIIEGIRSENDSAIGYFMKALSFFERSGDRKAQSGTLSNIARIIMVEERGAEALNYLRKAEGIDRELQDADALISDHQNMGNVFNRLDQPDSAWHYLQQAESGALAAGNERALASARYNLSNTLIRLNRLPEALAIMDKTEPYFRKTNNEVALIMLLYNKARIAHKQQQYAAAIRYLEEGLSYSEKEDLQEQQAKILMLMSAVYEESGDYKKALRTQKSYKAISDSMLTSEKSEIIARLQYQYETGKKEEQIRTLRQEAERRSLTTWLAIIAALAGLSLVVVLYLSKKLQAQHHAERERLLQAGREKAELAHQLEEKEKRRLEAENILKEEQNRQLQYDLEGNQRELVTTTIYIQQKNKMLEELQGEIQALTRELGDGHRQQLKDISRNLKSHLSFEDDWEKLKLHFEKVHPRFFEKLKETCPDLTMNELKHCAYIRINLASKEVANMMNVDAASVKMSRYRIKKKLQMTAADSLTEFILAI